MGVFKIAGFALLLLLCHPACFPGVNSQTVWHIFSANDMWGLQSLWGAWNESTPSPSSNLLNWYTPGPNGTAYPCYSKQNWRGVTCLRYQLNATQWDTWVVGLELNDASLSGTLPPGINQLLKLVSLKLTGNPNLTGNLPKELGDIPLNILDLHDNSFTGPIPVEFKNFGNLVELDLSGNQLSGYDIDIQQIFGASYSTQVFNIARNKFGGSLQPTVFDNMKQLLTLDLSSNSFTGPPPKFNFTNTGSTLYNLNLSYNNFTGLPELSQIFKTWLPQNVGVLDLSGLNIGGALPADWSSSLDLLSRDRLYLDDNHISGTLDIQSIFNLTQTSNSSRTLQVLSLKNNNITDVIFDKQVLTDARIKTFNLQGNPYCTTSSKDADGRRCFCEQYCAITPGTSKKTDYKAIIIPTVICGFLLGVVIIWLVIIIQRKNKHVHTLVKRFDESGVRAKRYEYNELRVATKNFAEERKLGQGAYGAVYKGVLSNNTPVAVKQLFMKTQQASEEFLNEILLITNLQHRNLVALKGYCLHGKEMLLVYEFVDYCDLDKLLFRGSNAQVWQVVSWPARKHICLGVAQGLYYLHASSQTKIIHRDIKASNILLDKDLNAKIADFGLARPIEDKASEIVTQQRAGTLGYLAPEYMLYGQLSEKADVYSFGVLLLEIVSGNRNKDPSQSEDDVYLPTRAWKLHKEDRLMDVMDPRLRVSPTEEKEVRRVLETAVMCVQTSPEKRPTMFRVVAVLAGNADDDAAVPANDSAANNIWPEFQIPSGFNRSEDRLLSTLASSSTTGSAATTAPFTNGNGSIEFTSLLTR